MKRSCLSVALLVSALVAGCTPEGGDGGSTPSVTVSSSPISHPTGADEVVVRVFSGGGLVPENVRVSELPEWTLYGDGTIVYAAPPTDGTSLPAPAVPSLLERSVPVSSIDTLLAEADRRGMLQNRHLSASDATDLWVTYVTLHAANQAFENSVYALGFQSPDGAPPPANDQSAQIAEVQSFIDFAEEPENWAASVTEPKPYEAPAWSVYAFPYMGDLSQALEPVDWPLDPPIPPLSSGTPLCVSVQGEKLAELAPVASAATSDTPWRSSHGVGKDVPVSLVFVPVLPGDPSACSK